MPLKDWRQGITWLLGKTRTAQSKHVAVPGFTDLTIGRPWWEEKSADHSEGLKTRVQDTEFDGLISKLLYKIVLGKIKKKSCILPIMGW